MILRIATLVFLFLCAVAFGEDYQVTVRKTGTERINNSRMTYSDDDATTHTLEIDAATTITETLALLDVDPGNVIYVNAQNVLATDEDTISLDDVTNSVTIGVEAADQLQYAGFAFDPQFRVRSDALLNSYESSAGVPANLLYMTSNGAVESPTDVAIADIIMAIVGAGYEGSSHWPAGVLRLLVTDVGSGYVDGEWEIVTYLGGSEDVIAKISQGVGLAVQGAYPITTTTGDITSGGAINAATGAITGDLTVADEAYGAGWDGSLEVPTKNAVYDQIEAVSASGVSDGDKGDVTVSSSGTVWTIDNTAVTLAKIQNAAANSKLIGSGAAGVGAAYSEITLGSGLTMTGTTLSSSGGSGITELTGDVTAGPGSGAQAATIANDAVTNAKIRDSGALSVIGRSANSTGDPADISATAATDSVLRESGSTIGFGTIATGGIANSAVTLAKIANAAANSKLVGAGSAGSGAAYSEISLGSGLSMSGTTLSASGTAIVTRINKTSDETTNTDTALSDDAALTFAVAANTKYGYRFHIVWNTPAAADFKFAFTCPSSPTLTRTNGMRTVASGTGTSFIHTASGDVETVAGTSTDGWAQGEGILQNGANAGNVTIQWAQNSSNGSNTTVYAGSYIEYWVVS